MIQLSAYSLAERFIGQAEAPGLTSNPLILAMLKLDQTWPEADEVPWCAAFVGFVCWLLDLPRTRDLFARSWLSVGHPIPLENARVGMDVVIFSRGSDQTSGHVEFYGGLMGSQVLALGGNQGDTVSIAPFPKSTLLGVRRLYG